MMVHEVALREKTKTKIKVVFETPVSMYLPTCQLVF